MSAPTTFASAVRIGALGTIQVSDATMPAPSDSTSYGWGLVYVTDPTTCEHISTACTECVHQWGWDHIFGNVTVFPKVTDVWMDV